MEYNTLFLLCVFGGTTVGSLIDRVVGGVFATILGACAGLLVYSLARKRWVAHVGCGICVRQN